MHRTTIMLPAQLKLKAVRQAQRLGISFGELVRFSLEKILKNSKALSDDPLFNDRAVFSGKIPKDVARHHDKYLYGMKE